jgi:hypothetical protein
VDVLPLHRLAGKASGAGVTTASPASGRDSSLVARRNEDRRDPERPSPHRLGHAEPRWAGFNKLAPPRPHLSLACHPWSPDGKRLACAGYDDGGNPSRYGMYTTRASDGGTLRQLTTRRNGIPDDGAFVNDIPVGYSANGSWILVLRELLLDVSRHRADRAVGGAHDRGRHLA